MLALAPAERYMTTSHSETSVSLYQYQLMHLVCAILLRGHAAGQGNRQLHAEASSMPTCAPLVSGMHA